MKTPEWIKALEKNQKPITIESLEKFININTNKKQNEKVLFVSPKVYEKLKEFYPSLKMVVKQ